MKNNDIEKELNLIRIDFYEKTKNMTSSERVAFIKSQVDPIHQKYGIRTVNKIRTKNSI